ncbi:MAG: hypothetical protein AAB393_10100 [Bacteroidota bacterium]
MIASSKTLVALILLVVLTGCNTEWEREFIRQHQEYERQERAEREEYDRKAKVEFGEAIKERSGPVLSKFIASFPRSQMVVEAVVGIWNIILERFPSTEYTCSTTLEELQRELPARIAKKEDLVVAFAPITVHNSGKWEHVWKWTTQFWELAGQQVTVTGVRPKLHAPQLNPGAPWGYASGYEASCVLGPYGQGSHTWSCNSGKGGVGMTLDYYGLCQREFNRSVRRQSGFIVSSPTSLEE